MTAQDLIRVAILIAIFLLVAFPIHESAHAWVAYRLGDGTAKLFGRISLDPIVHFDPIGGLFLIISAFLSAIGGGGFIFGWAKPTPVNPANLRDRRNGEVWVAIAGPLSNLIMAVVGAIAWRILDASGLQPPDIVWQVLFYFVVFNVSLAIFNMIPVPPLDGSAVLFRLVSPRMAWQLRTTLAQYGFLIVIVGILVFGQYLGSAIFGVTRLLLGI